MIEYIFYALISTICLFALLLRLKYSLMKKVRRDNMRYKLFAVRDDIIRLVATENLSENDFVFRKFYSMVNFSIKHIDRFTLKEIIEASQKHKLTLEQDEIINRLKTELENKNPDVKEVIDKFFMTMIEILIEKSISLRIVIRIVKIVEYFNFPKQYSGSYNAYKLYQCSRQRLQLAT